MDSMDGGQDNDGDKDRLRIKYLTPFLAAQVWHSRQCWRAGSRSMVLLMDGRVGTGGVGELKRSSGREGASQQPAGIDDGMGGDEKPAFLPVLESSHSGPPPLAGYSRLHASLDGLLLSLSRSQ